LSQKRIFKEVNLKKSYQIHKAEYTGISIEFAANYNEIEYETGTMNSSLEPGGTLDDSEHATGNQ